MKRRSLPKSFPRKAGDIFTSRERRRRIVAAFTAMTFTSVLIGCGAIGITGDKDGPVLLHIVNDGQCTMRFATTGAIAVGTTREGTLAPSQSVKPLVQDTGSVKVSIVSAPAGQDVRCTAGLSLDSEGSAGRFILHEDFGGQAIQAHGMGVTLYANPRFESPATSITIRVVEQCGTGAAACKSF